MNKETKNEYLLLFSGDAWYNRLSADELQAAISKFNAWFEGLSAQGKLKGAQPLEREGVVVTGKNGRVVSDGPFAESKEAIGGYFLLNVRSLEEAIAIAKGAPTLEYGTTIEVRPVAESCPMLARAKELMPEAELAAMSA